VRVTSSGVSGWSSKTLSSYLAIVGDFDVTASFADLSVKAPDSDKSSGIQLGLTFMNTTKDTVEVIRRLTGSGVQVVETMRVIHEAGGTQYRSQSRPQSLDSGRFRLSRRGDVIVWMFSARDNGQFDVLRAERISDAHVQLGGIDFEACQ